MELVKAERQQVKIKLGLQGPSGAGKTFSALLIASGLVEDWNKIAVIDTENHSSSLYAHLGDFHVLDLSAPFTPERFSEAIKTCEKASMEVIIIDSISHEWEGDGGILNILASMSGNSFTNWNKITPRHHAFIQTLLQCNCHVIVTIRTKQDYILTEKNGKVIPEKTGLKPITRNGLDYELTTVFNLSMDHQATLSKDRTGLFNINAPALLGQQTGKLIKEWCNEPDMKEAVITKIKACINTLQLKALYERHPNYQDVLIDHFSQRKDELLLNPISHEH